MKDILKKDGIYLLLILLMAGFTYCGFVLFRHGFCTAYDQGYFLLKAEEALDGILTGKSQWNFFAVDWFPYLDLTNKVHSHIASWILMFASSVFATITLCVIKKDKKRFIKYFALVYTVLFIAYHTLACNILTGLNYVPIHGFLLNISLCLFLLYWYVHLPHTLPNYDFITYSNNSSYTNLRRIHRYCSRSICYSSYQSYKGIMVHYLHSCSSTT